MNVADLAQRKCALSQDLEQAKESRNFVLARQVSLSLADVEDEIAQYLITDGRTEDAIPNLISQAWYLFSAGDERRASECLRRAAQVSLGPADKAWVLSEQAKMFGNQVPLRKQVAYLIPFLFFLPLSFQVVSEGHAIRLIILALWGVDAALSLAIAWLYFVTKTHRERGV